MATIVTKNNSTASAVPTAGNLVRGELAVNLADKKLYTKNHLDQVVVVGQEPLISNVNIKTVGGQSLLGSGDIGVGTGDVTLSGTQTLTNKTISGSSNTLSNIPLSTAVTGTLSVSNGGTGQSSLTANNVILGNGTSALQVVAPSTSGNVLTSNGTTWTSSAPPLNAVLLSTVTASNSSTVDIETTFNSTYDRYLLVITKLQLAGTSGAPALAVRLKVGGSYQTSSYRWGLSYSTIGEGVAAVGSSTQGSNYMFASPYYVAYSGNHYFYGHISIFSPADTDNYKAFHINGISGTAFSSEFMAFNGGGQYIGSTSAMTGIRFLSSTGDNINSGTFRLYGIKNS